ncbi:MAG: Na(+)/H(+) antiporter subunit A, partial [Flavobacterium sp.]|nr:Na(+)/H(+) antiporter subunit A [Flavobacterium sp.]
MIFTLILCFAVAILLIFFGKKLKGSFSFVLTLLPLSLFAFFASQIGAVSRGEIPVQYIEWVPSLGVNLSFRLDGLAL